MAERTDPKLPTGRRAGYIAAALVNLVLLWLADNLLAWGWPPFLTDEFEDLLPLLVVSFVATAAVNLLWAWHDPPWFKHAAQIALNAISLAVAERTWQIFPFDVSETWETVFRTLIVLVAAGLAIATIVELVALTRALLVPTSSRSRRPRSA